jgi:hypothetical protein
MIRSIVALGFRYMSNVNTLCDDCNIALAYTPQNQTFETTFGHPSEKKMTVV